MIKKAILMILITFVITSAAEFGVFIGTDLWLMLGVKEYSCFKSGKDTCEYMKVNDLYAEGWRVIQVDRITSQYETQYIFYMEREDVNIQEH